MKRFTDTEIWRKPWYRALNLAEREAWKYIIDTCDPVGVWTFDPSGAEYFIGVPVDWPALPVKTNDNIEILETGRKWWVADFCSFQYPRLKLATTSKPLLSYIELLKRHGLWERYLNRMDTVSKTGTEAEVDVQGLIEQIGSNDPKSRYLQATFQGLAAGIEEKA